MIRVMDEYDRLLGEQRLREEPLRGSPAVIPAALPCFRNSGSHAAAGDHVKRWQVDTAQRTMTVIKDAREEIGGCDPSGNSGFDHSPRSHSPHGPVGK